MKEKVGENRKRKERDIRRGNSDFFQSRRVIQARIHKQYTVKKKQIIKESNDRKIVYFLKLFLSRTGARRGGSEEDEKSINAREGGEESRKAKS